MTREEAKSKASIRIQLFDAKGANKIIDQIYNDYEAQLQKCIELGEKQALEFDKFFDAFGLKSESISIDDAIYFFKAKDDEIERLKEEMQEFVKRCEKGQIRSKYTYYKFKELLKDKK